MDKFPIEGMTDPIIGAALGPGVLLTHPRESCEGRGIPCCIHSPSDHHMRSFPMNWRADTGVMERICPHGIGHPDPDHMTYVLSVSRVNKWQGVHGCDGCCATEGSSDPSGEHASFRSDDST